MTRELHEEDPAIRIVREVYGSVMVRGKQKHANELLADEVAAVTTLHAPEIDPSQFRDIQMEYLHRKDELIASGHKEEQLAKRLDDLARKTQKVIAKRMGREQYERLMGVPPDVALGLVAPDLVGAAGVPISPQEPSREHVSRKNETASCQEPEASFKEAQSRWSKIAVAISAITQGASTM